LVDAASASYRQRETGALTFPNSSASRLRHRGFKSHPRNQLNRHGKVASLWRPFRLLGDGQHRGQIASQLDPEPWPAEVRVLASARRRLALLRSQDDRINQSPARLGRFQAAVLPLERPRALFDLRLVEVGHARMQQRRWLVGRLDRLLQLVSARRQAEHLVLPLAGRHHIVQHQVEQLPATHLDFAQLALRGVEAGALFHPQPVHLFRELATEFLEEFLAQQLRLQRVEHARFDIQSRDPQHVRAGAAIPGAEASEELARVDDEAGAALSALRQTGEQILRPPELVEAP